MFKSQNTILKKKWENLISVYQFWVLGWLILIGKLPLTPQEANGTITWPWIVLELGFQIWSFLEKFQVCVRISGAAFWLGGIRSWSSLCMEWIRSKKTIKNLGIHVLQDLISKNLFKYFSCLFGTNHGQLSSILSKSSYARNIEYTLCIKRFKT